MYQEFDKLCVRLEGWIGVFGLVDGLLCWLLGGKLMIVYVSDDL
jgi:hypothetical protein